jgi:hypothetical protein
MVAPLRDGSINVRALADAYMQAYAGRDTTRATRIAFWVEKLGDMPIGAVLDDHVQHALDELATRKARSVVGLPRATQVRRLSGALARKGYGAGLTSQVVREALAVVDAHAEEDDAEANHAGWD